MANLSMIKSVNLQNVVNLVMCNNQSSVQGILGKPFT